MENVYNSLFEPGNEISNAPENDSFSDSFMHLESRRDFKEDYMEVGEARQRLDYKRITQKIGIKGYFKGVST